MRTGTFQKQRETSYIPITSVTIKPSEPMPKQFETRIPTTKDRVPSKERHFEQKSEAKAVTKQQTTRTPQKKTQDVWGDIRPKENNPNGSNNQEKNILTWFDEKYKQKARLQPRIAGERTPPKLIPSRKISEVKGPTSRSDYKFLDSDRSLNISLFKTEAVDLRPPERIAEEESDTESTLSQRIQEYQKRINDFTAVKARFRELKEKRERTGDRSLTTEIEKIHSQLLADKTQIGNLLQQINDLKKILAS